MKCKNCNHKLSRARDSEIWLHDWKTHRRINCSCGCKNPEPELDSCFMDMKELEELRCLFIVPKINRDTAHKTRILLGMGIKVIVDGNKLIDVYIPKEVSDREFFGRSAISIFAELKDINLDVEKEWRKILFKQKIRKEMVINQKNLKSLRGRDAGKAGS